MVLLSSIFYAIYMSARSMTAFVSMTVLTKIRSVLYHLSLNSLSRRVLFSLASIIVRRASSNSFCSKVTSRKAIRDIYAGARNQWNFKDQTLSIVNTKARATNSGFTENILRRGKNRDIWMPPILAFSALTCNTQCEKML